MVDWISLKFKLHAFQTRKPCGNIGRWRSNYDTEQIKHWTMSVYWPSSSRCTWKLFCFKEGSNQIQEQNFYIGDNKGEFRCLKQLTSWTLITKKYNENRGVLFTDNHVSAIFVLKSCESHNQCQSNACLVLKKSQWPEWWLLRLTVHILAILQLTFDFTPLRLKGNLYNKPFFFCDWRLFVQFRA